MQLRNKKENKKKQENLDNAFCENIYVTYKYSQNNKTIHDCMLSILKQKLDMDE